jgi:deferrochelatase/peroxidase EfeB
MTHRTLGLDRLRMRELRLLESHSPTLHNKHFPQADAGDDQLLTMVDTPVKGGYYFVPPLRHHTQPWSWEVPAAE